MRITANIRSGMAYSPTTRGVSPNGIMRYQWRVSKLNNSHGILEGQFETREPLDIQEFSSIILANIRLYENVLNFDMPENLARYCQDAATRAKERSNEGG